MIVLSVLDKASSTLAVKSTGHNYAAPAVAAQNRKPQKPEERRIKIARTLSIFFVPPLPRQDPTTTTPESATIKSLVDETKSAAPLDA